MTYEHGDHVAIYPRNSPHTVAAACIALGWDADAAFVLSTPPGNPELLPAPFPGPITVRDALAHHVELLQHPDKGALLALAQCAANEKHAARLRWLAGHEGKADFASYILDAKRSLIEVLQVRTCGHSLVRQRSALTLRRQAAGVAPCRTFGRSRCRSVCFLRTSRRASSRGIIRSPRRPSSTPAPCTSPRPWWTR